MRRREEVLDHVRAPERKVIAASADSGQAGRVTELGRQDGDTLTVDLRTRTFETWDELWDALAEPCGLPNWFGRNLNAWWDTIQAGAISAVLDAHAFLVVLLGPSGMFVDGNDEGAAFLEVTNRSDYARAEVRGG